MWQFTWKLLNRKWMYVNELYQWHCHVQFDENMLTERNPKKGISILKTRVALPGWEMNRCVLMLCPNTGQSIVKVRRVRHSYAERLTRALFFHSLSSWHCSLEPQCQHSLVGPNKPIIIIDLLSHNIHTCV